MSARRVVPLALLVIAVAGLTAVSAGAKAPPVVQHTYAVTYSLSGSYSANTHYSDTADGFCPGTGYVEDATFHLTAGAKLKVKLQTGGHVLATALPSADIGTWQAKGSAVSQGDDCSAVKSESCGGVLKLGSEGAASASIAAAGKGRKIVFGAQVSDVPTELSQPSDCDQTLDIFPVVSYSLAGALTPYGSTTYGVPLTALAKLGVGRKLVGKAKPVSYPDGYDVSTCNGSSPCIGTLSKLTSTITITRKK